MKTCTFFGHRECPETVREKLREVVESLITVSGVELFYVGNQGQFDGMVHSVLKEMQRKYPQIRYAVVLAYMPGEKKEGHESLDHMLPEGIEEVHPRYAISWRNKWMLRQSDYVVAYVAHTWGGAARYLAAAERQGKRTVNIAKLL